LALPLESVRALAFWKIRAGQIITLTGPGERYFRARLTSVADSTATVVPFVELPASVESPLYLTVFQALPEKERFELVLEKLTEIGVQRIVPFHSQRSITLLERDAGQKKSHRWPAVLLRAAKQCRRAMIPELAPVVEWPQVLEEMVASQRKLLFYEGQGRQGLSQYPGHRQINSMALIIGPEGGFCEQEVVTAQELGAEVVSLGPRILRTETAAIVAATACQMLWGDLDI
jgi:16S rRNA (uracil1498-N3)-methyltransferase